jgi:xylulose-5-phosphate/fructose-6-phosphate phosphoketolase
MIVLRSPKGWTGPKMVDGKTGGEHVAIAPGSVLEMVGHPEHLRLLEGWMKSYKAKSCSR